MIAPLALGLLLLLVLRRRPAAAAAPSSSSAAAIGTTGGNLTGRLSVAQVRALAEQTVARYGFGADPVMLTVMAWVESSGNASVGVHPDGVSIGLMGVTIGAARDNAGRGHLSFPATREALLTAEGSMYHAAAYVTWLKSWAGAARADEWVIRAYNAGPGGAIAGGGHAHLAAYARRKAELGL